MKKVAAALVVAALVGIGLLLIAPALLRPGFTASMDVTWYDKDGKPITFVPAFVNPGGQVVTEVQPNLEWALTSTSGATIESPVVSGTLKVTVRVNTPTAGVLYTQDYPFSEYGDYALDGDASWRMALSTLIGTPDENGKQYGWFIKFDVTMTATGTVSGDALSDGWTGSLSYKITWGTAGLTLEGQVWA